MFLYPRQDLQPLAARERAPAIAITIPPAISTALTTGDTTSLLVARTPMGTFPALMPSDSVLGIGTNRDAIPNTIMITPAINSIFIGKPSSRHGFAPLYYQLSRSGNWSKTLCFFETEKPSDAVTLSSGG